MLGFRVSGLRALGFLGVRVLGLNLGYRALGFRVIGLQGFRV